MIGDFAKNTFLSLVQKILSAFLRILSVVLIARSLGPERQGIFTLAVLLPSLLLIVLTGGISFATIFYLGQRRYSLKTAIAGNLFFTFFLSLIAIVFSFFVVYFGAEKFFPGVSKEYLYLGFLIIPFSCFFDYFSGILLGLKKIKQFTLVSFFVDFFQFVFIIIFLYLLGFKIKGAILSQVVSLFFVCLFLIYFLRDNVKEVSLRVNKDYLRDVFLYGLKTHLSAIFTLFHYRIDQFLINYLLNPLAVGFYSIAARGAEGLWFFSYAIVNVFFPTIVSGSLEFKKKFTPLVFRQTLIFSFVLSSIVFLVSPLFIKIFFSSQFLPSVASFRILIVGTFFISIWRILSQDIFSRNLPMINVKISAFSLLLNIVLNILLIPRYGIEGAAFASMISYFLMFVFTLFYYLKISDNSLRELFFLQTRDFSFYQRLFVFFLQKINFKKNCFK